MWQTEGRQPHEDGSRGCSDVSTSQGTPRFACDSQKLEEARKGSFLEPSEGSKAC